MIFFFWYVYPSNLEAMLPCPWLITDDAMPLDHLLRRRVAHKATPATPSIMYSRDDRTLTPGCVVEPLAEACLARRLTPNAARPTCWNFAWFSLLTPCGRRLARIRFFFCVVSATQWEVSTRFTTRAKTHALFRYQVTSCAHT